MKLMGLLQEVDTPARAPQPVSQRACLSWACLGLLLPARRLRAASWGLTPTATGFMTWLQGRAGEKAGPREKR